MLIFGLVVGPLVGIFLGRLLTRLSQSERSWAVALLGALCLVIVFALHVSVEAKVGLITGVSLGLLLSGSPYGKAHNSDQTHDLQPR